MINSRGIRMNFIKEPRLCHHLLLQIDCCSHHRDPGHDNGQVGARVGTNQNSLRQDLELVGGKQSFYLIQSPLLFVVSTMNKELLEEMGKKYANFKETRDTTEILLTTRLARALSESNLKRIQDPHLHPSNSQKSFKKEELLYVYCYGAPPLDNELQYLSFPGETILVQYMPVKKGQTEEETKAFPVLWSQWAAIIQTKINEASMIKPVVLVYHSFGTYLVSTYFSLFPNNRVIAMIDIGGLPLRFHPELRTIVTMMDGPSMTQIEENIDTIFETYCEALGRRVKKGDRTVNPNILDNKYQLLAFLKCFKDEKGVDWVFSQHKAWPKILKCFIFGRNDLLFTEDLLSEKSIYYSYFQKWDPDYSKQVSEAFRRVTGKQTENVQENFVFSIEKGAHSLHMQKKNEKVISKIVQEYLTVVEQIYSLGGAKL